ncbi:hypothetical protein DFH07DRAFT_861342 [Mycena maculata]|uniref:Uncharacterized protein n=1 Tax=Mycena maculata TaxID=230809 RepID=A0AAD7MHS5_9AGAR|nr:hypothetical protein DFH07DRAFT_861342 [Mycena maculata]
MSNSAILARTLTRTGLNTAQLAVNPTGTRSGTVLMNVGGDLREGGARTPHGSGSGCDLRVKLNLFEQLYDALEWRRGVRALDGVATSPLVARAERGGQLHVNPIWPTLIFSTNPWRLDTNHAQVVLSQLSFGRMIYARLESTSTSGRGTEPTNAAEEYGSTWKYPDRLTKSHQTEATWLKYSMVLCEDGRKCNSWKRWAYYNIIVSAEK